MSATLAFNIIFLIGFITYIVIRGIFEERTKAITRSVHHVEGLERAVMSIVFVGSLLLPAVYLFTPWLEFANYRLPIVASLVGSGVMIAALWLFWRAHADLGQNWSRTLELRPDHQLVTGGVYRLIRHPMYSAIWLFGIAQGLLLHNWLAGWSALACFAVMYTVRVPREERMMCEFFGNEYREYMQRTGRLWPSLRANRNQ